jgi:hypothetical protein
VKLLNKRLIFNNIVLRNYGYYSHVGLGKIDVRELTELRYASQFGFYALGPKCRHVHEWFEEASCKSQ